MNIIVVLKKYRRTCLTLYKKNVSMTLRVKAVETLLEMKNILVIRVFFFFQHLLRFLRQESMLILPRFGVYKSFQYEKV